MAIKAGCGGNYIEGLCCRAVIETKRVFDGCAFTDDNITLTLVTNEQIPQNANFVTARAVSSEFDGYTVVTGNDGCSRVCGDVVTKFAVTYELDGVCHTVAAFYREHKDVLLRLPRGEAIVPYSIEVQTYNVVASGAIVGGNVVTVTGCLLQLIKVTAPVDILVPTYGYCSYPPCTGCVCPGIAGRIFPRSGDE
ncbi:MAG: hypothetical protein OSJ83_04595 [Clostridia bacterium]|nr:hypothetical protein [Clostridia bacterium]